MATRRTTDIRRQDGNLTENSKAGTRISVTPAPNEDDLPKPEADLSLDDTVRALPDFVLVWNSSKKEATTPDAYERRSIFEYNLEVEGLQLEWESSEASPDLHVVKIWAPLEVLKRYSEILKLRLPMKYLKHETQDENQNSKTATNEEEEEEDEDCLPSEGVSFDSLHKAGCGARCWACGGRCLDRIARCLSISLDPNLFPKTCRKLTRAYTRDKEYLFDVGEHNMDKVFTLSIRSRIVEYILKRKAYKDGKSLENDAFAFGYDRLIKKKVYDAAYPLHDGGIHTEGSTRNLLYENWGRFRTSLKHQPLDTIRAYFGGNIALYFAWLGYYTRMLIFAAIFGIACFIYGILTYKSDRFVLDVCNKKRTFIMCPTCDKNCGYWKLSDSCSFSQFAYLFDNELTFFYSLFMSLWAAFFLEFWKRYVATITHHWDLSNFDIKDYSPRPEYIIKLKQVYPSGRLVEKKSSTKSNSSKKIGTSSERDEEKGGDDDNETKFDEDLTIPSRIQVPLSLLSYCSVLFLVVLALAALLGVIIYRLWFTYFLHQSKHKETEQFQWKGMVVSMTAAFLNVLCIMIFESVYDKLAVKLTEMEYPRTQPEFENSYTVKVFLLQFVNNYSSIFYVAFFKGAFGGAPHKNRRLFGSLRQEECGISCMPELCIQLGTIMIVKQFKSFLVEAFVPWIKRIMKGCCSRKKKHKVHASTESEDLSLQWLKDYDLLEWGTFSLTEEYLEMVLQFGFVTIFVSAFPLAAFFALINNIFELRVDAKKFLIHYRRPVGIRAKDIGAWASIVEGIVKIAIVSNACIIALTSNFIPKFVYRYFFQDQHSRYYGSLRGYLNHSLTSYNTSDIEQPPWPHVLQKTGNASVCYFKTYRYHHFQSNKYHFKVEFWQLWFARIMFVLLYQNFVAMLILFMRWLIPDVPRKVAKSIIREEKMINELILKQELAVAQKAWKSRPYRPRSRSQQLNTHDSRSNHSNK